MVRVAPVAEVEGGEIVEIADGTYGVEVMAVVDDGVSPMFPDSKPQFKWTFVIRKAITGDPDVAGAEVPWQWTGQKLTISKQYGASKFYEWVAALYGGDIPDDFDDTDQLIGRKAIATIKTPKGKTRAKIIDLSVARGVQPPPKPVEDDDGLF